MTKGETSKARIIEAAGELFWKNGYTKTGISEILKETGLPKGSFYFYFKSKVEVADAVLQYYISTIIELLQSIADNSDSWGAFCDSFLDAFQERLGNKRYYGCPLAVIGMEISFQEEELAKHYSEALEQIKSVFLQVLHKSGINEEQLIPTADLCLSIYEGNLLLYRIAKDQSQMERMKTQLKAVVERN